MLLKIRVNYFKRNEKRDGAKYPVGACIDVMESLDFPTHQIFNHVYAGADNNVSLAAGAEDRTFILGANVEEVQQKVSSLIEEIREEVKKWEAKFDFVLPEDEFFLFPEVKREEEGPDISI